MTAADDVVRKRINDVIERARLPEWWDDSELREEMFKVIKRLLKAEKGAAVLIENLNRAFDEQADQDRGIKP